MFKQYKEIEELEKEIWWIQISSDYLSDNDYARWSDCSNKIKKLLEEINQLHGYAMKFITFPGYLSDDVDDPVKKYEPFWFESKEELMEYFNNAKLVNKEHIEYEIIENRVG